MAKVLTKAKVPQPRIKVPAATQPQGWGSPKPVAGPKRPTAYTPFAGTPASPPPNAYDPALDAQAGQSQRGLADLLAQDVTNSGRRLDDYNLHLGNLATQLTRGQQDYTRNVGTLDQRFADQAVGQTNRINQSGLDLGGAGAQAQQARTFRYGIARAPIDTNWGRFQENNQQQRAAAGLGFQRGEQDQAFSEAKAGRENTFFQADINRSKWAQAAQAGYSAPTKPSNEHRGVGGQVFRTAKLGKQTVYVSPDGRVRAGAPGTAGWNTELDVKTGKPIRRPVVTGGREGVAPAGRPGIY